MDGGIGRWMDEWVGGKEGQVVEWIKLIHTSQVARSQRILATRIGTVGTFMI